MRAAVAQVQAKGPDGESGHPYSRPERRGAKPPSICLPSAGEKAGVYRKTFPLTPLGRIADPELAAIVARHHGIWSQEAEAYLLAHAEDITLINRDTLLCISLTGRPRQLRHPLS